VNKRELVAAIIVNWNAGDLLQRCVASLTKQSRPLDRIIVVDNNSNDGSVDGTSTFGSAIEVIRLSENVGFAAANNTAVTMIPECKWVALLNPDAFAEPDWLEQLLNCAAANPEFSYFASRMLCNDDPAKLDGAGDGYHFSGWCGRRGHKLAAAGRYLKQEEVFSACAAAALYRRDILIRVSGFDESFFCYVEDVDLGFRLRLRGYRCLYVPTAIVRHVGSGSTGTRSNTSVYFGHRNLVWTFFKNTPLFLLLIFLLPHLVMNGIATLWYVLRGQGVVILNAKFDAMKGLGPILKQRRHVQRYRTASTKDIATMISFWPYR
jgi:GT2 family glycosyltransferase